VYAGVQQALFDLIDAVSDEGCLIVMIEDVHWLDTTSAKLLRDMVVWAVDHSIFFAFTGRERPDDWTRMPEQLTEIHLPPLDARASKDVILGVVRQHGRELDSKFIDWCVRVAEGNPYFLQELANHWVETGNQNEIPSSLAAVLNERISRLSAEALLLLQICALLETNATLDRIEKLIALEPHRMLAAINELGFGGMLVIDADDSGKNSPDRLLSRHDLLSNVALARLTPPARAFLHRRAGTVLEREMGSERSASTLWDCAKHWQLAGNVGRAFQLAKSCATHLMDVGLPGAAAQAYKRCLDYCTAPSQTQQILEGQARAYFRACDWLSVGETISKARRISSSINPGCDPHDDLELMALRAQWRNHRGEDTLDQVLRCLENTSASPEHRVEAGTFALMLLDETCNHAAMPRVYTLVAKLAQATGVKAAARLEAALVFHTIYGDLSVAVATARSLIDEQRNTGNVGDLLRALYNASVPLRAAGHFAEVEATLLEARSVAIDHKVQFALAEAYLHLANFHLELGQNDAARHDFEQLQGRKFTHDRRRSMLEFSGVAARLALLSNRPSEARKFVPRSIDELKRMRVVFSRVYSASLCVALELACGRIPAKGLLDVLEEAHLLSRRTTCQAYPAYALYVGLKAAGEEERGSRLLKEYLESNRREPYPPAPELLATLEGYLPLTREKRSGRRSLPPILPGNDWS
jgi:tetratricopeptide (TPR) repeat protein